MIVYTVYIFHRFLPHMHHNCTSGEGKEGNLQAKKTGSIRLIPMKNSSNVLTVKYLNRNSISFFAYPTLTIRWNYSPILFFFSILNLNSPKVRNKYLPNGLVCIFFKGEISIAI
jgi:hypothetical protein